MQSQSSKTLVVFVAQSGALISRRLDQLPVPPAVGVVFNFDKEFFRQEQPPIVAIGRTAGGKQRDLDVMLFDVLSMLHTTPEVVEILRRHTASYTVPENEGTSHIIQVRERLEGTGCEDLVVVQCKRLPPTGTQATLSQMLAAAAAEPDATSSGEQA